MNNNQVDIAEGSFIANWPAWIRWVLFLPAAILGALTASLLYALFVGFSGFFYGVDFSGGFYFQLMSSAILGSVFIYAGAAMAPYYQFAVSIFLMVVHTLLLGFLFTFSFLPEVSVGPVNFGINAVVSLIASGYIVYIFSENEHRGVAHF